MIAYLLLALPIIYLVASYVKYLLYGSFYPPGPFPLPIIGNLNMLVEKDLHTTFYKLAEKYGDVFSFSIGMRRVVIVNRIAPAREALVTKGSAFAGRDVNNYAYESLTNGFNDIAFCDYGQYWVNARRLAHSALKIYGDERNKLEDKIRTQYEKLLARLNRKINEPVDLPGELGHTVINVICSKVFNRDYEKNDLEFQKILQWSDLLGKAFVANDIFLLDLTPIFRIFPLNCLNKIRQAKEIRDPLLEEILLDHENTFDPQNIRDLTDSLINSSNEETKVGSNHKMRLTRMQLTMIMSDMIFAGFDTTWKTLHWCVLYLLHWPKYQDLMFNELVQVLDGKRYPTLKDRQFLPVMQAVIQETLRLSSAAAIAITHKAIEDSSIDGKPVPKDTPIIFNIWAINHDEKEWESPEEFDPYRWIDDSGKFNPKKHRSFLTFSAGKRACLGETMARAELFLILSSLIRDFQILPNLEKPFPSLIGKTEFLLVPNDFDVILEKRD